jgi:rRNA-processing protein FCF1
MEGRDVFLTDDRPLRVMCRRLREEHGVPVVAMSLAEYLNRRPETPD